MAVLSLRNFTQIVSDAAAATQSACTQALSFATGTVMAALSNANAGMVLWLQYVALQVLAATRLATSFGADVDSFVGDYSLTRLAAVSASVTLTFARASTTYAATIPIGTLVTTNDGTQQFTTTASATIPAGTASVTVAASAVVAGTAGNVAASTIGLISTSLPYVDTVTNAAPATGGINAESDAALKARFVLYIAGLTSGTASAVASAIAGVQQGLTYSLTVNAAGAYPTFTVVVDDGSGYPPSSVISAVYSAVAAVAPIGTTFAVLAPTVVPASINIVLTMASTVVRAPITAAVSLAVSSYVNALTVGATLPYNILGSIVFAQSPLITNASITLNGAQADLVPNASGVVKVTAISVA